MSKFLLPINGLPDGVQSYINIEGGEVIYLERIGGDRFDGECDWEFYNIIISHEMEHALTFARIVYDIENPIGKLVNLTIPTDTIEECLAKIKRQEVA